MTMNRDFYDELPYTSNAISYAQPNHLATIATLFGMTPTDIKKSRILELACGDGANLIATAQALPQSECIGIDLSAEHIAKGQQTVAALNLTNITLIEQNILNVAQNLGLFDYIIVHGIYSWVTADVQDKILSICQQHLAPNGVAYVSYDTKPGWNMRNTIQEMIRFHTAPLDDESDKVKQLHAFMQFLNSANVNRNDAYSHLLREEYETFKHIPEPELFHEYLFTQHEPLYFHEFMAHADEKELAYLGDAYLHTMLVKNFPDDIAEVLSLFDKNLIQQEQYMDFLRNRHFRRTLLCHKNVTLKRNLKVDSIKEFAIAANLRPVANDPHKFENTRGIVTVENASVQEALNYLADQFPRAIPFNDLITYIDKTTDSEGEATHHLIGEILLKCYLKGLIEWHLHPAEFTITVSEKPQTTPLARYEAKAGNRITNLRCDMVFVENVICLHLLPYLDGTRDHEALLALLLQWVKAGTLKLKISSENEEIAELDDGQMRNLMKQLLEEALTLLAQTALLQA